ncbi:uncharacterized protein LOC133031285 [Cannabis sativa]|uniref:uncharacterized protein LOC133031285 n=1 Tax=Cannabis sativa TaxID=3483 RepID=UPI0029CA2DC7|nr:uncharacterized protein LOC133031285 [Cannabis sativa]
MSQLKLPPKVLNFLWRASSNSLPKSVPAFVKTSEVIEAAMTFWSIWTHRNDLIWNSKQPVSRDVVTLAKLNYIDWFNAQQHNVTTAPVDGLNGRYGVGFDARTAAGLVLEARVISKSGYLQPHVVEAIGIKEALSWSEANGWPKVVIESDCLRVINDLQKFKHMVSPHGHILYDCKNLIADFVDVSFNFVKRTANKVAHALTRSFFCEADRTFSGDTLPSVIASLVLDNLS